MNTDSMITGDLVKCSNTGSLGVVAKVILNRYKMPLKAMSPEDPSEYNSYQVLWFADAVMTWANPWELEKIPFNPDDTLDSDYSVTTL